MSHVVETQGLGKAYASYASARARVLHGLSFGRWSRPREHWALRDVSFNLERGASLGLIGANGAGKSTLLRLLAGASAPSAGRLRTRGRVASLLELGTGFHPDFSGRENARLCGVLLGASRRELDERLDAILDFAELGDALDAPLRTYSTGMAMRLGFAAALGLEPDILILDEVFAVGDQHFQKKCVDRLFAFRAAGGSLILASHGLYDVRQICDRTLWLDQGALRGLGPSDEVTHAYAAWMGTRAGALDEGERDAATLPPNSPRLTGFELLDGEGRAVRAAVHSGASLELVASWHDPRPARAPLHLGLSFTRQDGTLVAAVGTHLDGLRLDAAEGQVRLELPELALLAGSFRVLAHLFDEHGVHRFHELPLRSDLVVTARGRELGLVRLAHHWHVRQPESVP